MLLARALFAVLAIAPLCACADGGDAPEDAGDDGDVDAGGGGGTCGSVFDGTWTASGECFTAEATVSVTTSGCDVTFSSWSADVSGPTSATVDVRDVDFAGGAFDDCSGTLAGSGRRIDGTCPSAGAEPACTFTIAE